MSTLPPVRLVGRRKKHLIVFQVLPGIGADPPLYLKVVQSKDDEGRWKDADIYFDRNLPQLMSARIALQILIGLSLGYTWAARMDHDYSATRKR